MAPPYHRECVERRADSIRPYDFAPIQHGGCHIDGGVKTPPYRNPAPGVSAASYYDVKSSRRLLSSSSEETSIPAERRVRSSSGRERTKRS